jgi:hypothetical protein
MTTKNQTNMLHIYEDFVNSGKDLIDARDTKLFQHMFNDLVDATEEDLDLGLDLVKQIIVDSCLKILGEDTVFNNLPVAWGKYTQTYKTYIQQLMHVDELVDLLMNN